MIDIYKDITDLSKRDNGEYYIGDIVQIKMPKWLNVKNAILCGYNHITDMWVVKYLNTKSNIKYEEIPEKFIVNIKETTIKINDKKIIHKYDKELENYIKNN